MKTWIINEATDRRISPSPMGEDAWRKFCNSPMPMAALVMQYEATYPGQSEDMVICAGTHWCQRFAPNGTYNAFPVFDLGDDCVVFVEPVLTHNKQPIACEDMVSKKVLMPAWQVSSGSQPHKVIPCFYTEEGWAEYCKDTDAAEKAIAAFLAIEEDFMEGIICAGQSWCEKFAIRVHEPEGDYPRFYGQYNNQWTVINLGDFRCLFVTKIDRPDGRLPIYSPHELGDEDNFIYEIRNR